MPYVIESITILGRISHYNRSDQRSKGYLVSQVSELPHAFFFFDAACGEEADMRSTNCSTSVIDPIAN